MIDTLITMRSCSFVGVSWVDCGAFERDHCGLNWRGRKRVRAALRSILGAAGKHEDCVVLFEESIAKGLSRPRTTILAFPREQIRARVDDPAFEQLVARIAAGPAQPGTFWSMLTTPYGGGSVGCVEIGPFRASVVPRTYSSLGT